MAGPIDGSCAPERDHPSGSREEPDVRAQEIRFMNDALRVRPRSRARRWTLTVLGGLLLAGVGCGCQSTELLSTPQATLIPLLTVPLSSPPIACLQARGGGTLVLIPNAGLGFADAVGPPIRVHWPWGFRGEFDGPRPALVAPDGRMIAHEGDQIETTGGFTGDGVWTVCQVDAVTVKGR
jgi:hypothetical protein